MYFILTLFLASLVGIIFMIGRKWLLVQKGYVFKEDLEMSEVEYLEDLKRWAQGGLRKLGFVVLVVIIRLYVKVTTFFKKLFRAGLVEIDKLYSKLDVQSTVAPAQPNKFLKKMEEYKRKVKRIKERVKKEEAS